MFIGSPCVPPLIPACLSFMTALPAPKDPTQLGSTGDTPRLAGRRRRHRDHGAGSTVAALLRISMLNIEPWLDTRIAKTAKFPSHQGWPPPFLPGAMYRCSLTSRSCSLVTDLFSKLVPHTSRPSLVDDMNFIQT